VGLIVLNGEDISRELTDDLIAIVTPFAARIYVSRGERSATKK